MGFRLSKRFKLFPGVTINVSKSGVSTSVGTRGARMTFGHGKTRTTVGVPGTGIAYTEVRQENDVEHPDEEVSTIKGLVFLGIVILAIYAAWTLT